MSPIRRGHFIVLDGPEGAGKSTQVRLLGSALAERGHDVVLTYEPGGTPTANAIREVFLSGEHEAMTPLTELFLICAARAQHVAEVIAPGIEAGKVVISDRFSPSTVVYQGFAGDVDLDTVRAADLAARQDVSPDLTIILDVAAELGLRRGLAENEADRMESKGLAFHERVREGYLKYPEVAPEECAVINGQAAEHEVHRQILALVLERIGPPES